MLTNLLLALLLYEVTYHKMTKRLNTLLDLFSNVLSEGFPLPPIKTHKKPT